VLLTWGCALPDVDGGGCVVGVAQAGWDEAVTAVSPSAGDTSGASLLPLRFLLLLLLLAAVACLVPSLLLLLLLAAVKSVPWLLLLLLLVLPVLLLLAAVA
jgi:hypothetical protein